MTRLKAILVYCAIGLIALQATLAGLAPVAAAQPAFDPLAVICHSGGDELTPPDQTPHHPQACDHCVLCNVTVADTPAAATVQAPSIRSTSPTRIHLTLLTWSKDAGRQFATGPPPTN